MFCNKCGASLPEGSTSCPVCGAYLETYQEPAPANTGLLGNKPLLVLITMALSLLLILLSVNSTMNMAFYDIPAASMLLGIAEADPNELLEGMDDAIDDMEDSLEYSEDILDDDELEDAEAAVDAMKTLRDKFSINNFNKFLELVEDIDEEYNSGFEEEEIDEIKSIMNILGIVIKAFFVLPVLFFVLGGLRKSAGLTITAMVFTTISQLILCGIIWVVLSIAVGVVQVKLCRQIHPKQKKNQEYAY